MGCEEPSRSLIFFLGPMKATVPLSIGWAKGCSSSELHLLILNSEKQKTFFFSLKISSESQFKCLLCETRTTLSEMPQGKAAGTDG